MRRGRRSGAQERMGKVKSRGWERSLGKRGGVGVGDSSGAADVPPGCPVGSKAGWWDRPRYRCLQSPALLPAPPRSAPPPPAAVGLEAGGGDGMVREEERGCAVHPGSCSQQGRPRSGGWQELATEQAGRSAGKVSALQSLPLPGPRPQPTTLWALA